MTALYAVIPVKNQLKYTRALVTQLLEQKEGTVLVIDNGSTDGTKLWLEEDEELALAFDRCFWSYAPGMNIHEMWNYGLDWARYKAKGEAHSVALLNNDLWIGEDFLSRLDHVLRMEDRIGVAGGCYDQRPWPRGAMAQAVTEICADRYDGTGGLPGFAMMLRGEDGYRFPEELNWWFGDNDVLATLLSQQRLCVIARHAVCQHLDGGRRTGNWSSSEMRKLLEADQRWFERKWSCTLHRVNG